MPYKDKNNIQISEKVIAEANADIKEIDEFISQEFAPHGTQTGTGADILKSKPKMELDMDVLEREYCRMSPYVWSMKSRKLKGRHFDFDGEHLVQKRQFLIQPLEDLSEYKGYRKSRQVGISENSITEALWFMDVYDHTKVCYVLPSGRQIQDFSNTRVTPAIEESAYLSALKGEIQNVNLKQLSNSFLFLRSGALERLGEGIDADITFFDELDRMSPRIKVAFEESLQSSKFGWVRDISTPTVPNFGVDIGWEKSKQWHWYVKCNGCSSKQQITWLPDEEYNGKSSVGTTVFGVHIYVCKHCGKELTVNDRATGEWVAKFPDREPSFYYVNQMMACWISAEALWRKQEDYPFKQLFFNYCLGLPYLGDNILITETMIINALATDMRLSVPVPEHYLSRVAVGVDWGDKSWVVAGTMYKDKPLIVHLECIDDNDPDDHVRKVANVINRFNADVAVCDAGYGRDRNSKLLKMFPERIYSCFYPSAERGSKIFEPQWQDDQSKVSVDRTNSIKTAMGLYKSKDMIIARNIDQKLLETYIRHLCNMVSVKDLDEKTSEISEFIANMGADHFGHATNYFTIGLSKIMKMPKSEFFMPDSKMIQEAQREARQKDGKILISNTACPEVPGMVDMNGTLEKAVLKGVLHGECYAKDYKENNNTCFNCSQGRSCRDICQG